MPEGRVGIAFRHGWRALRMLTAWSQVCAWQVENPSASEAAGKALL